MTQQDWATKADPFTRVVEAVTDWDAASPCEGWSARDVLDHVIDTQNDFLTARGYVGAVEVPASAEPAVRWRAQEAAVRSLLGDPAVAGATYNGMLGPSTVGETLATFYGFDLIVHRWDLARSQGRDEQLTESELDLVDTSVSGWGEHAYAPGIFARPVEAPADADRQTRVLARTGRTA